MTIEIVQRVWIIGKRLQVLEHFDRRVAARFPFSSFDLFAALQLLTLEIALEYIEADELVEVTPSKLRLRKKELTVEGRKRAERSGAKKVGV